MGSESAFSREFGVFWGCKKEGLKVHFPMNSVCFGGVRKGV